MLVEALVARICCPSERGSTCLQCCRSCLKACRQTSFQSHSNLGNTTDVPSLDRESHWLVSKGANLAEQRSNNVTCVGFACIAVAVLHQDRAEDTCHFHVVGATRNVFLEAA